MWTTKRWLWSIYKDFCLWWVLSKVRGPLKHYYLCAGGSGFCIDTQSKARNDLQVPVMQSLHHAEYMKKKDPKLSTPPASPLLLYVGYSMVAEGVSGWQAATEQSKTYLAQGYVTTL